MKKILSAIAVLSLMAVACFGQTNSMQWTQEAWDAITGDGSNWVAVPFATYVPKLENSKQWGGGFALERKLIGNNVLIGPRVDYVNSTFYMVSGNVTLQLPFHPIKNWSHFLVTPFTYGGVGLPFGKNATTQLTGIVGAGDAAEYVPSDTSHWAFGIAGDVEKWTSVKGNEYRLGPFARFNF